MALELNGSTGVSLVQDGVVTAADLASTLDLTGKTVTLPAGTTNAGKVLQVVSFVYPNTSSISTTSTSFSSTGISVSITPTSASSKVFILANFNSNQQAVSDGHVVKIYRNGSDVTGSNGQINYSNSSSNKHSMASIMHFDSPATTSALTYELYHRSNSGGAMRFANDWLQSRIIAMEIAA